MADDGHLALLLCYILNGYTRLLPHQLTTSGPYIIFVTPVRSIEGLFFFTRVPYQRIFNYIQHSIIILK
jgi:hypothetical protein